MLPISFGSVWMRVSGCSNTCDICFKDICESLSIIAGYLTVGVSSYSLQICVWRCYSRVKVTHQYNKIVKWNVTQTVSEIASSVGTWARLIVIFGLKSVVTKISWLHIILMFKICLTIFSVIIHPIPRWDFSAAALYTKLHPSIFQCYSLFICQPSLFLDSHI